MGAVFVRVYANGRDTCRGCVAESNNELCSKLDDCYVEGKHYIFVVKEAPVSEAVADNTVNTPVELLEDVVDALANKRLMQRKAGDKVGVQLTTELIEQVKKLLPTNGS